MKSALNLDLTRSNARSRREDFDCIFFIHVGAFCVELRPFYCKKRISVPMSYISWLSIDVYPNVSRYTRTCPGTPRRERDRPCLILLTITNGTSPYVLYFLTVLSKTEFRIELSVKKNDAFLHCSYLMFGIFERDIERLHLRR